MNTDELIALINELSATIRALREELSAMRADNEALRAELGLPVAEIPETAIPDIDVAPPVKPVISSPESPDPNIPETDTVLPVPNVSPPGLTRDEAIDNLPATEMMVQHEDDYLIRIDPQAVQTMWTYKSL